MARARLIFPLKLPAFCVLVAGLLASVALFSWMVSQDQGSQKTIFERRVQVRVASLDQGMGNAIEALQVVNQLFVTNGQVSRQQFHSFTRVLRARYPYIESFSLARLVSSAERPAFEARMRADHVGMGIVDLLEGQRVPAGLRERYRVSDYLEPMADNEAALGVDALHQPIQDPALGRAADTGLASATAPFQFFKDTRRRGSGRSFQCGSRCGFRLLMAVYRERDGAAPDNVAARRLALTGYTVAVLHAGELLETILGAPDAPANAGLDVRLYAAASADESTQVYGKSGADAALRTWPRPLTYSRNLDVAGTPWHLRISTQALPFGSGALYVFLMGLLTTVAASAYLQSHAVRAQRIVQLVASRTEELQGVLQRVQVSEASLAQAQRIAGLGSWTFDPLRGDATWSAETWRLFGIEAAPPAPSGRRFLRLLHPDERRLCSELVQALHAGRPFDRQLRIVCPNGEIRWLHALGHALPGAALWRGTVMDITRQNVQEEALTQALEQAAAARATLIDAIECLNEAFVLFDADDRLLLCNRGYTRTFTDFECFEDIAGMRFEDLVRASIAKGEVIEADFHGDVEAWVAERIRRHRDAGPEHQVLQLGDGRWLQVSEQRTRSGGIVGVRADISANKQFEQRQAMEYTVTLLLAESETLGQAAPRIIQTLCETLGWECGSLWHWDPQERVLLCAESWSVAAPEVRRFVALSSRQRLVPGAEGLIRRVWSSGEPLWMADIGAEPDFLRGSIALQAGLHAAFAFPVRIGSEPYGVMEFYMRTARRSVPALLAVTRSIGSQIGQFVARKAAQEEIRQLAFYDPLTGLPNRRLLTDRLRHALPACIRSQRHGALLFIDLDHFKTINDTLGHDQGDLLLQQVAVRLSGCVREGDTVARQGGDEFVIMLMDLSEVALEAALQTELIGEKIIAALNLPYRFANQVLHTTASIGATLFDGHIQSTDEQLKRADLAMYQAKAAGRNGLRFFEADMQAAVSARAELEADLRQGLQGGQFLLHYQAQMDGAGCVTGAEALLRWQHPRHGLILPAEFIPVAEESGLILPLGLWVLETACAQLVAWSGVPATAHLTLAVNVSARQFRQPAFVPQVMALLERGGANPHRLKLKLTESLLLDNVEQMIAKMSALKALGVGFSLDDFGTGYSSLSYLKRLPLDQIKIDQSFVRDVLVDPNDAAIVRTIIALAQSLGLAVIAEGVETEAQRAFLASNGCQACQGHLYSRALPLAQFEAFNLAGAHAPPA